MAAENIVLPLDTYGDRVVSGLGSTMSALLPYAAVVAVAFVLWRLWSRFMMADMAVRYEYKKRHGREWGKR